VQGEDRTSDEGRPETADDEHGGPADLLREPVASKPAHTFNVGRRLLILSLSQSISHARMPEGKQNGKRRQPIDRTAPRYQGYDPYDQANEQRLEMPGSHRMTVSSGRTLPQ